MSNRNAILLRPHWIISNQLTLPLVSYNDQGKASARGLIQILIPITIFLDTLFDDKAGLRRSMESDQYQIFKSLEGALQATGVDGKSCLLRTICEMQKNPIGEFTIIGEIVTVLLTPKRGVNDFLHEYLEAERIGQSANMSCAAEFPTCPVSLFNLFRSYSTPQDRPLYHQSVDYEEHNTGGHSVNHNSNHQEPVTEKLNDLHQHHQTDPPFDYDNSIDY